MRKIAVYCIVFYQKWLSPDQGLPYRIGLTHGGHCVFTPSCSEYTKQAIEKYGVIKGVFMGTTRIARCHPWQKNRFDPVP